MKGRNMRWAASAMTGLLLAAGAVQAVPAAAPAAPEVAYDSEFGGTASNKTLRILVTSQDDQTDGFRAKLIDRKGKVVQTLTGNTKKIGTKKTGKRIKRRKGATASVTFSRSNAENVYRVEVEGYSGGEEGREYGKPAVFYALPQPVVTNVDKYRTVNNSDVKETYFRVKWKPVSGAGRYEIYAACTKKLTYLESKMKFKKITTLKGSKSGYTMTKYNGKKLDMKKYYYYLRVVSVKKGKRIWTSPDEIVVNAHNYYK